MTAQGIKPIMWVEDERMTKAAKLAILTKTVADALEDAERAGMRTPLDRASVVATYLLQDFRLSTKTAR